MGKGKAANQGEKVDADGNNTETVFPLFAKKKIIIKSEGLKAEKKKRNNVVTLVSVIIVSRICVARGYRLDVGSIHQAHAICVSRTRKPV